MDRRGGTFGSGGWAMKEIQKALAFIMSFIITLFSVGWSFISLDRQEVFMIPVYKENQWQGENLYINKKPVKISAEGGEILAGEGLPAFQFKNSIVINVSDKSNKSFNYFGFSLQSSECLKGKISYGSLSGIKTEEFFIEKSDKPVEFFSFIDGYFDNAKACNIKNMTFENFGSEPATLTVGGIATYNRAVLDETVFICDSNYKIGVSLLWGGSLSYLEYLKANVQAVRTADDVIVGVDSLSKYGGELITDEVNLINRCDTGRVVQQSYYGTNGENDGYIQGEFLGSKWSYNPVQGGNKFGDASKIVNCKIGRNSIYIKCRPMDWGKDAAAITPSYMEATYTLIDGYVKVDCRFTDFSQWESVMRGQELPAFYAVEPLNSFRYYGGSAPWTGDAEIKREDNLIFWPDAGMPTFEATEYWCAWTNLEGDGFGLGLYVPGISKMLAGVFDRGGKIGDDPSTSSPTSYVAALKTLALKSFVPLEYSYLVAAGNISDIRQTFAVNKDAVDNTALLEY